MKDRPGRTASRQPAVYTCTPAQTASEPAPLLYCGWLASPPRGSGQAFAACGRCMQLPQLGYSALRPDLMRRSTPTIILHVQALHGHAWTGTAHAGRAGLTRGPFFFLPDTTRPLIYGPCCIGLRPRNQIHKKNITFNRNSIHRLTIHSNQYRIRQIGKNSL